MSAKIFVVEDERLVAEDIRLTLAANGYAVVGTAACRDEAMAGIGRTLPDVVLMDIVLKGAGDGVEAAGLVRRQFNIPVVYLTAHADQATLRRAKLAEPFGYILKPFDERDLISGIEMALYRHRAELRIQESERWLATILASVSEGVIATDAMGVVRLMNGAAARIGGWDRERAVGMDLSDLYRVRNGANGDAVDVPSLQALIEQMEDGVSRELRWLVRADGGMQLIEQSVSPICDGERTVTGTVLVFREVEGERG